MICHGYFLGLHVQGAPRCDILGYIPTHIVVTCFKMGGNLKPIAKHMFLISLENTYKLVGFATYVHHAKDAFKFLS